MARPQGHTAAGRIRSIEKSNYLIGNWTRESRKPRLSIRTSNWVVRVITELTRTILGWTPNLKYNRNPPISLGDGATHSTSLLGVHITRFLQRRQQGRSAPGRWDVSCLSLVVRLTRMGNSSGWMANTVIVSTVWHNATYGSDKAVSSHCLLVRPHNTRPRDAENNILLPWLVKQIHAAGSS
jgi:hypothetical protein